MFNVMKKLAAYSLIAMYGMGFGSLPMDVYARTGHHIANKSGTGASIDDVVDVDNSQFTTDNSSISEASTEGVHLKLVLKNSQGKFLPNKTIVFRVKREGSITSDYELRPIKTLPDHDGTYVRQFIPKKEGQFTLDATIGTKTLHLDPPIFARSAKPGPKSTLEASPPHIFADGKTSAQVRLTVVPPELEELGPNISSRLKLFDGDIEGPAFSTIDPKNGMYVTDFTTTVVGEHNLTVKYDDELLDSDKMKAKVIAQDPDVVEVSKSTFESNLSILKVTDKKGARLTVSLKNMADMPAVGRTINFQVRHDGQPALPGTDYNIVKKPSVDEKYIYSFTAKKLGTYRISATVEDKNLRQIVGIKVIKDNPLGQESSLSPAIQTIKADNKAIATITFAAKDDDGHALAADITKHLTLWDQLNNKHIAFTKEPGKVGIYVAHFKTGVIGDYELYVSYDHEIVGVSKVIVHATAEGAVVDGAKSEIAIDKTTIMSNADDLHFTANKEAVITVKLKDKAGAPIVDKTVSLLMRKQGEAKDNVIENHVSDVLGEYKFFFSSDVKDKAYSIKAKIGNVIIDKQQMIYVSSGAPGLKSELKLNNDRSFHLIALTDQGGVIPADISKHLTIVSGAFHPQQHFKPVNVAKGEYELSVALPAGHAEAVHVLYDGKATHVPLLKPAN